MGTLAWYLSEFIAVFNQFYSNSNVKRRSFGQSIAWNGQCKLRGALFWYLVEFIAISNQVYINSSLNQTFFWSNHCLKGQCKLMRTQVWYLIGFKAVWTWRTAKKTPWEHYIIEAYLYRLDLGFHRHQSLLDYPECHRCLNHNQLADNSFLLTGFQTTLPAKVLMEI